MRRLVTILVFTFFLFLVAALSFLLVFKFEGRPPVLLGGKVPDLVGRKAEIILKIGDNRSGLRGVKVFLTQKERQKLLFEKAYPIDPLWGSRTKEDVIRVSFEPLKLGFKDGSAELIVQIRDASWRNGLKGNIFLARKKLTLDLTPPRVVVLSPMHYLVPGGSNLVVYRLGEPTKKQGIRLDDLFFKGYPLKDHSGVFLSFIALPVNKRSISRLVVEAEDLAGNVTKMPVAYYIRHKRYRHDTIVISDSFLQQKMPEFLDRYEEIPKGDLLKAFLWVNTELRRRNNEEISRITRYSKVDHFYLTGAMLRLPHSATRALFGDQRTYYYHRRKIGTARHLGIDLASVAGAPVPAAESGKVVFADYLGIYGNTVILDHGYGLFSLYAHLAGFNISVGDEVKRGQLLGYTDTTGLAGGDHLHFAVLVQGVFVEPQEWFDPQWVKTRVFEKLKKLGLKP